MLWLSNQKALTCETEIENEEGTHQTGQHFADRCIKSWTSNLTGNKGVTYEKAFQLLYIIVKFPIIFYIVLLENYFSITIYYMIGHLWWFLWVVNPFVPNGLFYLKTLDKSISCIRGVWLVFIIMMFCRFLNLMQTV